ncbi:MAG: hypothetical protein IKN24_10830, partial [Lachnospiraceae bacterium]|nr:hypothetical protein [Lachnospiraceae bacterium]
QERHSHILLIHRSPGGHYAVNITGSYLFIIVASIRSPSLIVTAGGSHSERRIYFRAALCLSVKGGPGVFGGSTKALPTKSGCDIMIK